MSTFAGRSWYYRFREVHAFPNNSKCTKAVGKIAQLYADVTKQWNVETNSQWMCRIYFASKMILNTTLNLKSYEYAQEHNLRTVLPYLAYYAALSSMRSLVVTLPTEDWNNSEILYMNHSKIINVACDCLAKFDKDLSDSFKPKILQLKAARELISYRAPSSGDMAIDKNIEIEYICTIFSELAQFHSEILENSIMKNSNPETFVFLDSYIDTLRSVKIEGFNFPDKEDHYRLDYLRRKYKRPSNILFMMTEGHTEDFFGAWEPDEEDESKDMFTMGSPCNWQDVFDIP